MMRLVGVLSLLAAVGLTLAVRSNQDETGAPHAADDRVRVLIIDGVNNHDWKTTTAATKAILEATDRFDVTVSTSPDRKAPPEEWAAWTPPFDDHHVVLSNFNDGGRCLWSEATKNAFVEFVHGGGGFVSVHAADNASADWPEYNEIIGVGGWGGRTARTHGSLMRKAMERWRAEAAMDGRSGHHGPRWPYPVKTEDPEHPIMRGLPEVWLHGNDELYNSLRGPCKNVAVLASAPSKVTQTDEPMAMLISYGEGRSFHLPMGHVGGPNDVESVLCVGFQTLLVRGTEFVATGEVTLKVPAEFPTADETKVRQPDQVMWSRESP